MIISYLYSYHYYLILADNPWFKDLYFMDTPDIDYLSIALLNRLSSRTFGTIWCNTDMFHIKLLIRFSLLINCRSNWLARCWFFRIGWLYIEAKQISVLIPLRSFGLLCVDHIATFLCQHTFWHARWDHNRHGGSQQGHSYGTLWRVT